MVCFATSLTALRHGGAGVSLAAALALALALGGQAAAQGQDALQDLVEGDAPPSGQPMLPLARPADPLTNPLTAPLTDRPEGLPDGPSAEAGRDMGAAATGESPGDALAAITDSAARTQALLEELADPDSPDPGRILADLEREWSKSGSAAMDLLLQRGLAALDEGDLEAALDHLTALTDYAPDFAEGWNARAQALYLAGQIGPALGDVQRALALNPRHFVALGGLGAILDDLGRDDLAAEALRASLAINPHQPPLRAALQALDTASRGTEL